MVNTVKNIIAKHLRMNSDDIEENTDIIEELGADSLDLAEIFSEFEEEFNLEIPEEDIEEIKTVRDIVEYLETRE